MDQQQLYVLQLLQWDGLIFHINATFLEYMAL
jgi:hypothetical protein